MTELNFLNLHNGNLTHNTSRFASAEVTTIENLLNSANGNSDTLCASFDSIDRNAGDATTVYWFEFNSDMMGLVISDNGEKSLVDCDSCPIEDATNIGLGLLLEM